MSLSSRAGGGPSQEDEYCQPGSHGTCVLCREDLKNHIVENRVKSVDCIGPGERKLHSFILVLCLAFHGRFKRIVSL